jgi:ABC-type polysaccharide/polyol phosphate transport system ATPase subunit
MENALSFEHVSKEYRGAREYRALRDDLTAAVGRLVGIGQPERHTITALRDVSFEVSEGSSMAIIGLNGAGKTTALKLVSRVTYPTAGVVRVRGQVGALIEVGTGMHPELTGRENVQLYGRIMGLSRRDVERRFDDIVEFAGIGPAIDQPVKQYSSGMQLRIGFSVAAHLEPDLFLVDEAIAVGDAGFQYRCVERMSQLIREGRTLIFVSHDMSAIETLCDRVILLKAGTIAEDGPAREVIRDYLLSTQTERLVEGQSGGARGEQLEIARVSLHNAIGEEVDEIPIGGPMTVRLHYLAHDPIEDPIFSLGLSDGKLGCFTLASMLIDGDVPDVIAGEGHIDCAFADLPLQPGTYELWGSVRGQIGFGDLIDWQRLRLFRITGDVPAAGRSAVTHSMAAPVRLPYEWKTRNHSDEGSMAGRRC